MLQFHESKNKRGMRRVDNQEVGAEGPSRFYLEIIELDWDWLDEVVAALSWEKPL